MNATQTAALPRYSTENPRYRAGDRPRFRPGLRVVYRAENPVAPAPVAVPSDRASFVAPRPVAPRSVPVSSALPLAATPAALPARPVVSPSPVASPLRLTRRGRIVVAVMAVLLAAGLSLAVAAAAQATSHTSAPRGTGASLAQVVVLPGQSLWSVAETADPHADTRLVIQQITQLNRLASDTVFAGQRLWVPRS